MKDYYQILGIGERASPEEVYDRWRELTEPYHPGLEGGTESEERIQEINEAYHTLKTPNLRFKYDLQRNFRRSVLKHLAYSREQRKWRIKKRIYCCGISAIFLVVGSFTLWLETPWVSKESDRFVVPENNHFAGPYPPLEAEEYEKSERSGNHVKFAKIVPPDPTLTESPEKLKKSPMVSPPEIERESGPTKEPSLGAIQGPEPPEGVAHGAPREPDRAVIPEEPKDSRVVSDPEFERKSEPIREASVTAVKKPEEPVGPAKDALLEPSRKGTPKEPKESPAASPLTVNRKSEHIEVPDPAVKGPGLSAREAKVMPSQPNRTVIPEGAKTPTSSLVLPSISGESEIKQFLARYTERYNQKDIDGFISFFSSKAVQNQKDDIEKIRKAYANFFQHNEELRYKVRDVKIEPHRDGVQVMADYELEGVLKKGKEKKVWRGQVRWVLIREEGALRVLSLDYQPQR